MDTASIKQLKDTLSTLGREELTGLLLRMVKFKKENKELLTFLLFEAGDLDAYVYEISLEIKDEFLHCNVSTNDSYGFIKFLLLLDDEIEIIKINSTVNLKELLDVKKN